MTAPEHVVLSIGSNLGDREATLRAAVRDLAAVDGLTITGASGLVQTAAVRPDGVDPGAPPYLNAVVLARTTLPPERLLAQLQRIELDHGRVREVRWGDRTLDIDIVAYGSRTRETPELTLPHPRAAERAFVLAPWLQADPDAVLPGRGSVRELLAATGETVEDYPAEPLL